jgi:hypothetical protein
MGEAENPFGGEEKNADKRHLDQTLIPTLGFHALHQLYSLRLCFGRHIRYEAAIIFGFFNPGTSWRSNALFPF